MAGYTVINVASDQIPDTAGNLQDVYDITFTVDPRPNQYTVQVPLSGDPVANAQSAIQAVVDQVNAIYGL